MSELHTDPDDVIVHLADHRPPCRNEEEALRIAHTLKQAAEIAQEAASDWAKVGRASEVVELTRLAKRLDRAAERLALGKPAERVRKVPHGAARQDAEPPCPVRP